MYYRSKAGIDLLENIAISWRVAMQQGRKWLFSFIMRAFWSTICWRSWNLYRKLLWLFIFVVVFLTICISVSFSMLLSSIVIFLYFVFIILMIILKVCKQVSNSINKALSTTFVAFRCKYDYTHYNTYRVFVSYSNFYKSLLI